MQTAQLCMQCEAQGKTGSFLSSTPRPWTLVSPVFSGTVKLFDWCKENGWRPQTASLLSPYVKETNMTNNTSSDEARAALLRDIIRHGGYLPEDQILALGHSSETLQAAFDRGDLADFFGCPGLSNDNIGA